MDVLNPRVGLEEIARVDEQVMIEDRMNAGGLGRFGDLLGEEIGHPDGLIFENQVCGGFLTAASVRSTYWRS